MHTYHNKNIQDFLVAESDCESLLSSPYHDINSEK